MTGLLKNKFVIVKNKLIHIKIIKFLKVYKAPFLSGLLLGFSFIPFPFFTLFFCISSTLVFYLPANKFKEGVYRLLCMPGNNHPYRF